MKQTIKADDDTKLLRGDRTLYPDHAMNQNGWRISICNSVHRSVPRETHRSVYGLGDVIGWANAARSARFEHGESGVVGK